MNKMVVMIKASEVLAVRKAIFEAGAQRVVVNPVRSSEWESALSDWYQGSSLMWKDAPVRMDIFTDKSHASEVMQAFMKTAHVGKVERISQATANNCSSLSLCLPQAA